jgi:predicted peptidase
MSPASPSLPSFSRSTLRAVTDGPGYGHLISVPPAYGQDVGSHWPLILFLHGAGERGHDLWSVARHGLARLLALREDLTGEEQRLAGEIAEAAIVVAPQCPVFEVWNEPRLVTLLDGITSDFRVDRTRVYLTGLSLGGFGTWTLGLRHAPRFAALVPICGGGRVADVLQASDQHGEALRTLGVWAFHGANDRVVPPDESRRMVHALEMARVHEVRLTMYPDVEHDAWTRTYADPKLYTWLWQQRRERPE